MIPCILTQSRGNGNKSSKVAGSKPSFTLGGVIAETKKVMLVVFLLLVTLVGSVAFISLVKGVNVQVNQ